MSITDQGRQAATNARLAALQAFRTCWARALSTFEIDVIQQALAMVAAGRSAAITEPMVEVVDRSWAALLRDRDLQGRRDQIIFDRFAFQHADEDLVVIGQRRGGLT